MNNYKIKQYISNSNSVSLDVIFASETIWLSVDQLTTLFNKNKSSIYRQISKIIDKNELSKDSVVAKFATTALDGKTYKVSYYSLDVITLLGIISPNVEFNEFKIWADETIKSHYINLPINLGKLDIKSKIHIVRGQQVMFDFDLANLYGYTTRRFNEQVNRNIDRFDEDFMFRLTKEEYKNLKSQIATSSWGGTRSLPYAFTEQGIYMLASVLKGTQAIEQHKLIIRTLKGLREYFRNELNISTSQFFALGLSSNSSLPDDYNLSQIPEIEKEYNLMLSAKEQVISTQTRMLAYTMNRDASEIKNVVDLYSKALIMLDDYDHGKLVKPEGSEPVYKITYQECREVINSIDCVDKTSLFGLEKENGALESIINNVYQAAFGREMYQSIEEKAAHLLYFIVKDHPFADGCKRIAATLFLYFLDKNKKLITNNKLNISSDALAVITLLIAESRPHEKDTMISVVMNLLTNLS